MFEAIIEKQRKTKENIIKNFHELSSTDLMDLSRIAKEIVKQRIEKCEKMGLFGEN